MWVAILQMLSTKMVSSSAGNNFCPRATLHLSLCRPAGQISVKKAYSKLRHWPSRAVRCLLLVKRMFVGSERALWTLFRTPVLHLWKRICGIGKKRRKRPLSRFGRPTGANDVTDCGEPSEVDNVEVENVEVESRMKMRGLAYKGWTGTDEKMRKSNWKKQTQITWNYEDVLTYLANWHELVYLDS